MVKRVVKASPDLARTLIRNQGKVPKDGNFNAEYLVNSFVTIKQMYVESSFRCCDKAFLALVCRKHLEFPDYLKDGANGAPKIPRSSVFPPRNFQPTLTQPALTYQPTVTISNQPTPPAYEDFRGNNNYGYQEKVGNLYVSQPTSTIPVHSTVMEETPPTEDFGRSSSSTLVTDSVAQPPQDKLPPFSTLIGRTKTTEKRHFRRVVTFLI